MNPELEFFLMLLAVLLLGKIVLSRMARQGPTDRATECLLQLDGTLAAEDVPATEGLLTRLEEFLTEIEAKDPPVEAEILRELRVEQAERVGTLALLEERFEQARDRLEFVLEFREEQLGELAPGLISPLGNLLLICLEAEDQMGADTYLQRILSIAQRPESCEDTALPLLLRQTAIACYYRRYHTPALQLMEQIEQLLEHSEDLLFWQETQLDYIRVLITAGKIPEADEKSHEVAADGFPDEVIESQALHLRGIIDILNGNHTAAQDALTAALKIVERRFSPDQPQVSQLLGTFTDFSRLTGRLDQARRLGGEALASLELQPLPSYEELAMLHFRIALISWRRNELAKAKSCLTAGRTASRGCSGQPRRYTDAMLSLAEGFLLLEESRFPEAESRFRHYLLIMESLYEPEHLYTIDGICLIGVALSKQHRFEEAEEFIQRAMRLRETKSFNPLDLAEDLNAWAEHLLASGRPTEALPVAERAWKLIDELLIESHPVRADLHQTLAAVHRANHNIEQASTHDLQAEAIRQRVQRPG